jgi:hypothetical protein
MATDDAINQLAEIVVCACVCVCVCVCVLNVLYHDRMQEREAPQKCFAGRWRCAR